MLQNKNENLVADVEACNPIDGISKDVVPEQVGIADFANDAGTCAEIEASAKKYYTLDGGADVANLVSYLERPVLLTQGTFVGSTGPVYSYNFNSSTAIRTALGALNFDRMRGAVGFRATLVFTVSVARSAFNQGICSACFQYAVDSTTSNLSRATATTFPLSVHLPNVRINIADETLMKLEVPYVSMKEYWPVNTAVGVATHDYGVFSLVSLAAFDTVAGQSPASYTIYLSLKDIEFIGAQPFDLVSVNLQAGLEHDLFDRSITAVGKKVAHEAGNVLKHVTGRKDTAAKEKQRGGLVSKTLGTAADVASFVSKVPGLSVYGGMADWFLRGSAKVASSMGFSKPHDETKPERVTRYAYDGTSQVDIPSTAFPLSPFGTHKLAINGAVGCTEEDQMDFDYILQKYSYIFLGNLLTTQAAGDLVYAGFVMPSAFWFRDGTVSPATGNIALKVSNSLTENAFLPSTLCYLGSNFRLWRGGFKFRVSFAKTKLHGGRVQFTYVPYEPARSTNAPISTSIFIPTTSSTGPAATGHVMIFDLQDANEFEFEVPYVSNVPYLPYHTPMGSVSMQVIQPLRTNGVAPTVVDFMVEVCALPSFEFAVPCPSMMQGVARTGTLAVSFQSGIEVAELPTTAAQDVVGERFQSVKQVAMQPDFFSTDINNLTLYTMVIEPWFKVNRLALATPNPTNQSALWFASRSARMADMYAFVRGSTLISVTKERGSANITHSFRWEPNECGSAAPSYGFYSLDRNLYSSVYMPDTLESGRAVIPVYSRWPRLNQTVTTDWFGGTYTSPTSTAAWNAAGSTAVPYLTVRNSSGATTRVTISRAAADDAMMSQFVGPPPVHVLNSLSTTGPAFGAVAIDAF